MIGFEVPSYNYAPGEDCYVNARKKISWDQSGRGSNFILN